MICNETNLIPFVAETSKAFNGYCKVKVSC